MPEDVFNPVTAAREHWPALADWDDATILQNLQDPAKFRSAFPEYAQLSDDTIRTNMVAYLEPSPAGPGEEPTTLAPTPKSQFTTPEVGPLEKIAAKIGNLIPSEPEGPPQYPASPIPGGVLGTTLPFVAARLGTTPEALKQAASAIGKALTSRETVTPAAIPVFKETAEKLYEGANKPLLPIGQYTRQQIQKAPDDDTRWVLNSIMDLGNLSADTIEGLSTPANVGILTTLAVAPEVGVGLWIKRLTALGFAEEMARASANKLTSGFAKAKRGEYRAAGRDFASGVVDASFAVASGLATRRTPGFKPGEKAAVEAARLPPEQVSALRPAEEPMTGPVREPTPPGTPTPQAPGRTVGYDSRDGLPIIERQVPPVEGPYTGAERRLDFGTRMEVRDLMERSGESDPQLALAAVREAQHARMVSEGEAARLQREAGAAVRGAAEEPAAIPAPAEEEARPLVPPEPETARLRVREATYRGTPGFTITGSDTHGRDVSIFTETAESARRIKSKIGAGQEVSPEDFRLAPAVKVEAPTPPQLPLAPEVEAAPRPAVTLTEGLAEHRPAMADAVRRRLELGERGGHPAFFDGTYYYDRSGKYEPLEEAGNVRFTRLHDLTEGGLIRAFDADPDALRKYYSYNRAAEKLAEQARTEELAKQEARGAEEEQKREESRQAESRFQEHRAGVEQDFQGVKFTRGTVKLDSKTGEGPTITGPSIGGLIVHKTSYGNDRFGNTYDVSHAASGLKALGGFSTQREAKIAAWRLSRLADFTRSAEELNQEFSRNPQISKAARSLSENAYAEFPEAKPAPPKRVKRGAPTLPMAPRGQPSTEAPAEPEFRQPSEILTKSRFPVARVPNFDTVQQFHDYYKRVQGSGEEPTRATIGGEVYTVFDDGTIRREKPTIEVAALAPQLVPGPPEVEAKAAPVAEEPPTLVPTVPTKGGAGGAVGFRAGESPSLPTIEQVSATPEMTSKADVLRTLQEELERPFSVGRFKEKALGIYKVLPEGIDSDGRMMSWSRCTRLAITSTRFCGALTSGR